ncbi:MAG: hypothetical protein GY705_27475 [Bacteroidetes bacterium]|nr:hypothetical protein [Bacteroidota bacterium]
MKLFKIILLTCSCPFLLMGCSNDYKLDLGKGYYLIKLSSTEHAILKEDHTFYNYGNKGVNITECLERQFHKENCYGLSSERIVESNIEEFGMSPKYIFGKRKGSNRSDLDEDFFNSLVPLQPDGYFIIDKGQILVELGLTKKEIGQRLSELKVKPDLIKPINDGKNRRKAFPQMILSKFAQ